MESSTEEKKDLLKKLERRVVVGRKHLMSENITFGKWAIWAGSVRHILAEILGKDSPVALSFRRNNLPKDGDPRVELQSRIENIEKYISAIRNEADRVFFGDQSRGHKIFIGHGRSSLWRELKDFLNDRLELPWDEFCLLYTSPSPRDLSTSRMPSSA